MTEEIHPTATTQPLLALLPGDTAPLPTPPSATVESSNYTLQKISPVSQQSPQLESQPFAFLGQSNTQDNISSPQGPLHEDKMPLGIGRKAGAGGVPPRVSKAAQARTMAQTNVVTSYEASLQPRDREAEKDFVRRYLAERVKSDWTWPPKNESR